MQVFKKAFARVLNTVAQGTKDGGMTVEQIVPLIKADYNKDCTPDTAIQILHLLKGWGLVTANTNQTSGDWSVNSKGEVIYSGGNQAGAVRWICTEKGLAESEAIRRNRKHLLEKTTSPNRPMHL